MIICGTCWWKQFFFCGGQDSWAPWKSLPKLFIFSHNDWWLPALLFFCGDSHSSHQRSHSKKQVHFPLREFQVLTNSSSLLHTDTSFFQSIFRRSKILALTFPVPFWEQSGNSANYYSKTKNVTCANNHMNVNIRKKDWKMFRDIRHIHEKKTFHNFSVMRTHRKFQKKSAIPKYNNYNQ